MSEINFSVILPSYHEAENLKILLPRLIQVADKYLGSYEILVVDAQKSLDDTKGLCFQPKITYLNRAPNNFYGDAVRTGIQYARGDRIIFMDSDGSHTPEFLAEMIKNVNDADLLIASRYMPGGMTENTVILVFMSKILNAIYSKLLKINCYDISNSFRIYQSSQLKALTLRCQNFDIIQEILFSLINRNPDLKIKEIPFTFKKRISGKSKRSMTVFIISYFKTLIKLVEE